jgi:catechol 2,3-dioxygenase-like lactoylglutathione lyase family enzyme
MFRRLDHAIIAVRNLEEASATYARLLGRRPSWQGRHPYLGTANTLFRLDNTYVELLSPAGGGPLAADLAQGLERRGEGLLALALGTDDAIGCAATLRARGVAAPDPVDGEGREATSGAVRRWRTVPLPRNATRGVTLLAIQHHSPPDALPVAEPWAHTQGVVAGVDHVVIMTGNPEAACVLYRDQLGLRLALDRTFADRGVRLLFFRVGGITVECAARLDATPRAEARDRLWGISYRVTDLPAAHDRLVDAAFDVSEIRQGQRPGTIVCTIRRETHGVATLFIGPQSQPNTAD